MLDVVAGRLQQLSDGARRLVTLVAVAGDRMPLAVAVGLGDVDAVDELLTAGFLVDDDGGVAFPHALARRAVVETVTAARRAALHLEVARVMEACGAAAADLAHHYYAAAPLGDHEPVVRHGLAAADAALRSLAFEDAVAHAERALPFAPASSRARAELLLRLGSALHAAGDLSAARVALQDAERIALAVDDAALAADAVLEQAHYGAQFGAAEPEIAAGLRRSLDRIGGGDDARRARLLARLAIEESAAGNHDDARALAAEALDLARTLGDDALLLHALAARHHVLDAPEHLEDRLALARELEDAARRVGDLAFLVRAIGVLAVDAAERGDVEEQDRCLAELHRLVTLRRVPHEEWFDLEQQVLRAVIAGDLDAAEAVAERELTAGRNASVANALRGYGLQLLIIRAEQGRSVELVDLAVQLAEQSGAVAETAMAAYACLAADRIDDAAALFGRLDVAALPRDSILLGALCVGAELAMHHGDLPLASRVYEQLLPFAGRTCTIALGTVTVGPIDRYLSYAARTIGELDRARDHLLDAIALDERMGAARWLERDRADLERETTWESSPRRSSTG